jgi:drug/metabolite transporter (DMT)-like permease
VPWPVAAVVLLAALLHATWNALLRRSTDRALETVRVAAGAGVLSAVALAALPAPARESWPFIAASAAIHIAYFALLAAAYRAAFAPVYTVMRGGAPALVALASYALGVDQLSASAWAGIALVSIGVAGLGIPHGHGGVSGRALMFALSNACVIAAYTLVDGAGVRRAGNAASYTLWIFVLDAVPLVAWTLRARGASPLLGTRSDLARALATGALTIAAYALVLWAMTRAPVAAVAAMRETAVVFAWMIGAGALRERASARPMAAAALVALGAALLKR